MSPRTRIIISLAIVRAVEGYLSDPESCSKEGLESDLGLLRAELVQLDAQIQKMPGDLKEDET